MCAAPSLARRSFLLQWAVVRQRCITAQKTKMSEGLDKDRASVSSALLRLREHRGREDEKTESWRMGYCSELLLLDTPWLLRMKSQRM